MLNDEHFIVYPEYTHLDWKDYQGIALDTGATVIGGNKNTFHQYAEDNRKHIQAIVSREDGHPYIFAYRGKTHLTSGEKKEGFVEAHPKNGYPIWDTNRNKILVLICYEICFPEDYYHLAEQDIDAVFHLVGFPMFDRNQYKPWYALQKAIVKHFDCPLVSSCGGDEGDLNLTHVITPEMVGKIDEMGTFTVRRE
jgi:predicted amidohydrolase